MTNPNTKLTAEERERLRACFPDRPDELCNVVESFLAKRTQSGASGRTAESQPVRSSTGQSDVSSSGKTESSPVSPAAPARDLAALLHDYDEAREEWTEYSGRGFSTNPVCDWAAANQIVIAADRLRAALEARPAAVSVNDTELLARWAEAYQLWLDWYHDETPNKGWGVGQDAAFHMGRVGASLAARLASPAGGTP